MSQAKRLSLLMDENDTRLLLASLMSLPGCSIQPQECGQTSRIALDGALVLWFVHPVSRLDYRFRIGHPMVVEGQLSTISASDGAEARERARGLWSRVSAVSSGDVYVCNPTTNELGKKVSGVRVGPGAAEFWRNGGVLGSFNAQLHYGVGEKGLASLRQVRFDESGRRL